MALSCVDEISFDTADEFLAYLRPSNTKVWGESRVNPWIYRGQWNAAWSLVPSVFRPTARDTLKPILDGLRPHRELPWQHLRRWTSQPDYALNDMGAHPENYKDRILDHLLWLAAEYEVVWRFAQLADELGFHVLTASDQELTSGLAYLKGFSDEPSSYWPRQLVPSQVFAFAQHHGIPTRLLDWTRNPLTAAFFAATLMARGGPQPERIAVWAFDRGAYDRQPESNDSPWQGNYPRIIGLTCQRHLHSFLHAQAGLFQWAAYIDLYYLHTQEWLSFDSILNAYYVRGTPHPLRKMTLPLAEADRLLFMLARDGVTRAHLMPTYDNVAHTLKDQWVICNSLHILD